MLCGHVREIMGFLIVAGARDAEVVCGECNEAAVSDTEERD